MDEAREAAFRSWMTKCGPIPELVDTLQGPLSDAFDAGWDAGMAWAAMPTAQREVWHATRRNGPDDEPVGGVEEMTEPQPRATRAIHRVAVKIDPDQIGGLLTVTYWEIWDTETFETLNREPIPDIGQSADEVLAAWEQENADG